MDDARIRLPIIDTPAGPSITVKRNCSISPQALVCLLAFTAAVSFGIGIAFAVYGAWPVLPFVGLEIGALAAAFYVNGRHATDHERIALAGRALTVEIRDAERIEHHRFNADWVQIMTSATRWNVRVALRSHGRELEIGRHLDAAGRELLAKTLREWLGRARTA